MVLGSGGGKSADEVMDAKSSERKGVTCLKRADFTVQVDWCYRLVCSYNMGDIFYSYYSGLEGYGLGGL